MKGAAAQELLEEHAKAVRVRVGAVAQEVRARRVRVEARRAGDRREAQKVVGELDDLERRPVRWPAA